jgi:hypothetical protein
MKKVNTCLFFLLCFALGAMAQTTIKRTYKKPTTVRKNSVSAHITTANALSLNYLRKIAGSNTTYLSGGIGLAANKVQPTELSAKANTSFALPHNVLFNFGTTNGHFGEIGVGAEYNNLFANYRAANYNIFPMFGYRYQPTNSKLFLHLFFAPIVNQDREVKGNQCLTCPISDRSIMPTGGIGAGWSF